MTFNETSQELKNLISTFRTARSVVPVNTQNLSDAKSALSTFVVGIPFEDEFFLPLVKIGNSVLSESIGIVTDIELAAIISRTKSYTDLLGKLEVINEETQPDGLASKLAKTASVLDYATEVSTKIKELKSANLENLSQEDLKKFDELLTMVTKFPDLSISE